MPNLRGASLSRIHNDFAVYRSKSDRVYAKNIIISYRVQLRNFNSMHIIGSTENGNITKIRPFEIIHLLSAASAFAMI